MENGKMKSENNNIKGKKECINTKKENKKIFSMLETIILVIGTLLIGLTIGSLFGEGKIITQSVVNGDEYLKEFIKNYNLFFENYHYPL